MKKFVLILLNIILISILWGCDREDNLQELTGTQTISEPSSTTTITEQITFAPELIQQITEYRPWGKRYCYISSVDGLDDYFPPFAYVMLYESYGRGANNPPEMYLVTLIKQYNVPKEKFEEAIQKTAERLIAEGRDLTQEEYELPNADIIYTFDNEIIDAYYRRENPIAPDWLTESEGN